MSLFGGISLPELSGVANLSPNYYYNLTGFGTTGLQWIRFSVVPAGKVHLCTYLSFGFNGGSVSDALFEVEDATNTRLFIISMRPSMTTGLSVDFPVSIYMRPGWKLAARFNVVTTTASCWVTAPYTALDWEGV